MPVSPHLHLQNHTKDKPENKDGGHLQEVGRNEVQGYGRHLLWVHLFEQFLLLGACSWSSYSKHRMKSTKDVIQQTETKETCYSSNEHRNHTEEEHRQTTDPHTHKGDHKCSVLSKMEKNCKPELNSFFQYIWFFLRYR